MLTLAALPWTAALRAPAAPALHTATATLDFRGLDGAASGVAARLARRGIGPKDRVVGSRSATTVSANNVVGDSRANICSASAVAGVGSPKAI